MTAQKTIMACDLFCGSGGTSTGLLQAAEELGLGISVRELSDLEHGRLRAEGEVTHIR